MSKYLAAVIIALMVFPSLRAQVNMLALVKANDSLGASAHSILQYQKTEFTVTNDDRAILKEKKIITVLDKQGDDELLFAEYSSAFVKLEEVTITTYSITGVPQKTYSKKDLYQRAMGGDLVNEGMYYYMRYQTDTYPATIEYEYTYKFKGIFYYPSFTAQYPGMAIRQAEQVITVPKQFNLRYKNQLTGIKPEVTELKDIYTYKWKVENVPASKYEDGMGSTDGRFSRVLIAPTWVNLDNYKSDFNTWNDFGKWIGNINKGTLNLNDEQKNEIKNLVSGVNDPKEKAKILYEYLQNNFRYVSIQLGIGGLKSFPASFTHEKKYGDCKALSTYMKACLDAVGIKSFTALVNAGRNQTPAPEDFPIDIFNHVILCIPFAKDTTWLDCTSTTNDFGILSAFTENRNALIITDTGGMLVPTPATRYDQNKFNVKSVVTVHDDGSGEIESTLYTNGEYRDYYLYKLYDVPADEQKETIIEQFELPAPESFELKLPDQKHSSTITAIIKASFEKVVSFKAGNKLFLPVSWQKVYPGNYIPKTTDRKYDFYFRFPFENSDTTIYKLPAGFIMETIPKNVTRTFKYGEYSSTVIYKKETSEIISVSHIKLTQHKIPAEDFAEMKVFFSRSLGNEVDKIVIKPE